MGAARPRGGVRDGHPTATWRRPLARLADGVARAEAFSARGSPEQEEVPDPLGSQPQRSLDVLILKRARALKVVAGDVHPTPLGLLPCQGLDNGEIIPLGRPTVPRRFIARALQTEPSLRPG